MSDRKIFGRDINLLEDLRNDTGKLYEFICVDHFAADEIERLKKELDSCRAVNIALTEQRNGLQKDLAEAHRSGSGHA